MGQKINPISLRLQKTNRRYDSSWYSNYHYGELFLFDLKVRDYLQRVLKQLKYPEGRALISHFSKGSKINLFAFNPTESRQQKLGAFGLKGSVQILRPARAQHVNQEGQRKLSPALAKSLSRRNELKRPLKALSSRSKAISMDQKLLLVNQSLRAKQFRFTCSEKKNSVPLLPSKHLNTNKNGNKWNPFLPYLALSWSGTTLTLVSKSSLELISEFISKARIPSQPLSSNRSLILDEKTHGDLAKQQSHNTRKPVKQIDSLTNSKPNSIYGSPKVRYGRATSNSPFNRLYVQSNKSSNNRFALYVESKSVPSCSTLGTKCVPSEWHVNGSHLVPFFALKDTLNPSYLLKAKRLRDSWFALHAIPNSTLCAQQKRGVISETLSLWYQRAQGSTHPVLVCLGADKRTFPFLTKETGCKAVAKSNPTVYISVKQSKTYCESEKPRGTQNRLLVPSGQQKQQSFSLDRNENSLYRCHVEGVLDQQTGSSVKLVPFQVSTEKQSALFLAQEVVYFLEKRVSFRKIKDQILNKLKGNKIIKGVRITCSGRVGGKSKKAQKAKTETFKQGQTSLGVFSSRIDFAQKSALTGFGLIGVKVWICFY